VNHAILPVKSELVKGNLVKLVKRKLVKLAKENLVILAKILHVTKHKKKYYLQ
jgi:hypothetical protein